MLLFQAIIRNCHACPLLFIGLLESEADIDDYFKSIEKEAEMIVKMQLDGGEKVMRETMQTMQRQALLEKTEAGEIIEVKAADKQHIQDKSSSSSSSSYDVSGDGVKQI